MQLSLEHGISKFTAKSLVQYGAVASGNDGYRYGRLALSLLQRFDTNDQLPVVYATFYGYTAVRFEPIQACAAQLKRGFEIGMSIGETANGEDDILSCQFSIHSCYPLYILTAFSWSDCTAFGNGVHFIHKSLLSGANLSALKIEAEYILKLMEAHSQDFPRSFMKLHHQTIAVLISRDSSTDDQEAEQGASKVMELSEGECICYCDMK
jgi:hypothetical protein